MNIFNSQIITRILLIQINLHQQYRLHLLTHFIHAIIHENLITDYQDMYENDHDYSQDNYLTFQVIGHEMTHGFDIQGSENNVNKLSDSSLILFQQDFYLMRKVILTQFGMNYLDSDTINRFNVLSINTINIVIQHLINAYKTI